MKRTKITVFEKGNLKDEKTFNIPLIEAMKTLQLNQVQLFAQYPSGLVEMHNDRFHFHLTAINGSAIYF